MSIIRDAQTSGALRINDEGQALTLSEVQTEARHVSDDGDVYAVSTPIITGLATANTYRTVLYLKNTDNTKNIHIGLVQLTSEESGKWRWVKNPTGVTNSAGNALSENFNFSSTKVIVEDAFYGDNTTTTDGGVEFSDFQGNFFGDMTGSMILGPGNAIAFEFANNTGVVGDVTATLLVWQV